MRTQFLSAHLTFQSDPAPVLKFSSFHLSIYESLRTERFPNRELKGTVSQIFAPELYAEQPDLGP